MSRASSPSGGAPFAFPARVEAGETDGPACTPSLRGAQEMNEIFLPIRGIYRDVVIDGQGRVTHDPGWVKNTIVTRCRVLIAAFLRGESAAGLQYMAVGQGDPAWDAAGTPPSNPDTTVDLVARYSPPLPLGASDLAYLDATDQVQLPPSPRLQVTCTLGPGYPAPLPGLTTFPLREFGLFARLGGSDSMVNSIRHPVIHKDQAATLIRVVRLYF
jgi:hypothetical protein